MYYSNENLRRYCTKWQYFQNLYAKSRQFIHDVLTILRNNFYFTNHLEIYHLSNIHIHRYIQYRWKRLIVFEVK